MTPWPNRLRVHPINCPCLVAPTQVLLSVGGAEETDGGDELGGAGPGFGHVAEPPRFLSSMRIRRSAGILDSLTRIATDPTAAKIYLEL